MNSIFQMLFTIPEFCQIISKFSSKLDKTSITHQLALIINPESRKKHLLRPFITQCFELFKHSKPFTQQDASEFLLLLIDKITSELKEAKEDGSIIEDLFKAETVTEYYCEQKKIKVHEQFFQLDLEIFDIEEVYTSKRNRDEINVIESIGRSWGCTKEQPPVTILDCIRKKFRNFEEENVEECLVCRQPCKGVAETKLSRYPQYLFLLIKRYKFDGRLKKINRKLKLLNEISICEQDYELISIVRHSDFLGRKHFRAYCKEENVWVECDDEKVKIVTQKTALDVQPYFILYRKKDQNTQKTEISSQFEAQVKINQNSNKYQLEESHVAEGDLKFEELRAGNQDFKYDDWKENLDSRGSIELNKVAESLIEKQEKIARAKSYKIESLVSEESVKQYQVTESLIEKQEKLARAESYKIQPSENLKNQEKVMKSNTLRDIKPTNKVAPDINYNTVRYSILSNKTDMSEISIRQVNIDTGINFEFKNEEENNFLIKDVNGLSQVNKSENYKEI